MFDWLVFEEGRARFCGSQRDTEVGSREVLAVELGDGRNFYGEFDTKYTDDHTNYNVEVFSFGYGRMINVGMSYPQARAIFLRAEIENIRSIIIQLMREESDKPFPIHIRERFTGVTLFREGWIRAQ